MITTPQPARNPSRPNTRSPNTRSEEAALPSPRSGLLFCELANSARALLEARLEYELSAQKKFLARRIGCPHTCEDLAQDSMLIAWRNIESFRGASKLSTWITGISANLSRQFLSRAPQYRQQFSSDELDNFESAQPEPSAASETEELLDALEIAIAKLKPELRDAFTLVVLNGQSYEMAAKRNRTTVNNIKNRVHRARRALRDSLVDCL